MNSNPSLFSFFNFREYHRFGFFLHIWYFRWDQNSNVLFSNELKKIYGGIDSAGMGKRNPIGTLIYNPKNDETPEITQSANFKIDTVRCYLLTENVFPIN